MLKLNFFTSGSTDFTHGGSSFFNHSFIEKYKVKYKINVFFLNEKKSFNAETNKNNFTKNTKNLTFKYFFFSNRFTINTYDIGKIYFERIHDLDNIRLLFNKNLKTIKKGNLNFCKDFVWAKLLSENQIKNVCLIGDPFIEQLYYDFINADLNIIKKTYVFFKYFFLKNYLKKFLKNKDLKKYTKFITHIPNCKKLYKIYGLDVKYVPTFQSNQKILISKNSKDFKTKGLNLLFLGRSGSSASRKFFNDLDKLCDWLSPFNKVNIYIVTDKKTNYLSNHKNIKIIFQKKKNSLNEFSKKIDFGIYFSQYNIGIRQRIIFMMSLGIPVICYENNKESLIYLKNLKDIIYYNNKENFRSNIQKIINNKKLYFKLRINSLKAQRVYYNTNKNLKLHMNEVLLRKS